MSLTSFTFTQSLVATAVISAFALTGCGGGGGSSDTGSSAGSSDTGSTPASYSESASGTAAKGIIKNATVTAFELDAQGLTVRTVGTSETGADGKYVLSFDSTYTGGPLKLVLTAKPDGSTVMVCDVQACGLDVAFGQDYPLPASFTLAAFAANSGSSISTQITPYSDMAAARIQAQINQGDSLDASLIADAISEVSQLVGVNIAAVQPIDITNQAAVAEAGSDALQYAAFNAGVGAIAFAHEGGFEAGVAALSESFADGQFDNSDPVSIVEIVGAVGAVGERLALMYSEIDTTALTATLASIQANTSADGIYNPEPAPAATQTAVGQAKELISQIRTWGTEIAKLRTPADAFGLDVDAASAVINSNSGALAGVFGSVIAGALDTVLTEAEFSGLLAKTYTYPITHWTATGPVTTYGSVSVIDNGGSLKLDISAQNSGVTTRATVATTIPSTVLGKQGRFDVASLSITASGTSSMTSPEPASISFSNTTLSVVLKEGKTTAAATDADIASMSMSGGLAMEASGVSFTGTGRVSVVANNVTGAENAVSLEEIALDGTVTSSKGSARASASVKIHNAATFDTIGLLDHEPVLWVNNMLPGDVFGVAAAYEQATGDTLQSASYNAYNNETCAFGSTSFGFCQSGDVYGLAAKVESLLRTENPTAIGVPSVYAHYDSWGMTYYGGVLTFGDFESASNFAKGTVTVSAGVELPGYPAATLSVTGNRTAYSSTTPVGGDLVGILTYNGQSVRIEANNTVAPEALTIANPDGVKLTVTRSDAISGQLTVNGTSVGTVSSSSGITLIRYADGTFESLN